ncbi:MAG: Flp pilus assembly protein CpaB [Paracoccaceae bacterium]
MRIKSLMVTLIGVALAGGSVMFAKEYLNDTRNAANASINNTTQTEMSQIVVARDDINFGQPVSSQSLLVQAWPRDALPKGSFTEISQVVSVNVGEERRALTHLFAGDIILSSKLAAPGERVTLVQKLGENTRAVSISVNAVTAVGGFVTPGDHVDIVLTQNTGGQLRAGTILQDIRVIGVDQQSQENTDQPTIARTVTVEVTADQGQRLALAQRAGQLSLTLRTLDRVENQTLELVELSDLFAIEEKIAEEQPEPVRARTIIVRRGNVSEEVVLR